MADRVDAAIAALKVALAEAEKSKDIRWKVGSANRWINQLPGAWWGRWRHLKLRSEYEGKMSRDLFVSELRAVLAYMEINRDEIKTARAWPGSYFERAQPRQEPFQPTDVEFSEVKGAKGRTARKTGGTMRLITK